MFHDTINSFSLEVGFYHGTKVHTKAKRRRYSVLSVRRRSSFHSQKNKYLVDDKYHAIKDILLERYNVNILYDALYFSKGTY